MNHVSIQADFNNAEFCIVSILNPYFPFRQVSVENTWRLFLARQL